MTPTLPFQPLEHLDTALRTLKTQMVIMPPVYENILKPLIGEIGLHIAAQEMRITELGDRITEFTPEEQLENQVKIAGFKARIEKRGELTSVHKDGVWGSATDPK